MNIDQQSILKDIFSTLPFKNPRRIKREKRRLSKPLMIEIAEMLKSKSEKEVRVKLKSKLRNKFLMLVHDHEEDCSSDNALKMKQPNQSAIEYEKCNKPSHAEDTYDTDEEAERQFTLQVQTQNDSERWKRLPEIEQRNKQLVIKNYFMERRSRELRRLKLSQSFQPRSVLLCDNANFSEFTGHIDEMILAEWLPMVEMPQNISHHNKVYSDSISQIDKYSLKGEFFYGKVIRQDKPISFEKNLSILSYESKILGIIGKHHNIIDQIGLSFFSDDVPVLLIENLPKMNIEDYIKNDECYVNLPFLEAFIQGLSNGLSCIHDKSIIHNLLHGRSIFIDHYSGSPMISNFLFACRIESAKCITFPQKERFECMNHLPSAVRNSVVPPSISSDVYSFAYVLSKVLEKIQHVDKCTVIKLNKLVRRCFCNKSELRYLVRDWKYW